MKRRESREVKRREGNGMVGKGSEEKRREWNGRVEK